MGMLWSDIAVALGFVLVIEGLFYALFPGTARRVMTLGLSQPKNPGFVGGDSRWFRFDDRLVHPGLTVEDVKKRRSG